MQAGEAAPEKEQHDVQSLQRNLLLRSTTEKFRGLLAPDILLARDVCPQINHNFVVNKSGKTQSFTIAFLPDQMAHNSRMQPLRQRGQEVKIFETVEVPESHSF